MATANDLYQRLLFRHATDTEGYEAELVASLAALLADTEADLVSRIRVILDRMPPGETMTPRSLRRLDGMLGRIRDIRTRAWVEYNSTLRQELLQFMRDEVSFGQEAFARSIPIEGVSLAAPTAAALRAAVVERPFRLNDSTVRTLAQYMASIREQDRVRIEQAIRLGYLESQNLDQIIQRIRGTRAAGFRDGILALSARNAETIVRTAVNHYANSARATLWSENTELFLGLVWTAVLDRRTTLICQSRDGHVAPIGDQPIPRSVRLPRLDPPNAVPPAHANCRSILVAIISPEGLVGDRPFVVEKSGRRVDFNSAASRRRWAIEKVGRVPARVNYEQFIRSQDFDFQVDVYGPTRARLLREGGLSIEDLVDRNGRRYTLAELRRRNVTAFEKITG